MRPGWQPTRRNRNIGTAKQGHGQSNCDKVPLAWDLRRWSWLRGREYSLVKRPLFGLDFPFIVERTLADCVHACTVDDLTHVLRSLSSTFFNSGDCLRCIRGVVLSQPTRKEMKLRPAWASLCYGVDVDGQWGAVIYISAQQCPTRIRWSRSLSPSNLKELARLRQFSSKARGTKRAHVFDFDLSAVRRMQLSHSLLHELGHYFDMISKVDVPYLLDQDELEPLTQRFWGRTSLERENYAHDFADTMRSLLEEQGVLPFDRILEPSVLESEGLQLDDFLN